MAKAPDLDDSFLSKLKKPSPDKTHRVEVIFQYWEDDKPEGAKPNAQLLLNYNEVPYTGIVGMNHAVVGFVESLAQFGDMVLKKG